MGHRVQLAQVCMLSLTELFILWPSGYSSHLLHHVALRPNGGYGLLILEVSRSHPTTHHGRWAFSGREINPLWRPLPDKTQHTDIHAAGGHRARKPSQRAAVDPRLTTRGN